MKISALSLALLFCLNSSAYINNGIEVSPQKHPAVALLVVDGYEGTAICTGTYIARNKILTAYHCAQSVHPNWIEVDGQKTTVTNIEFHPDAIQSRDDEVKSRIFLRKNFTKSLPLVKQEAMLQAYKDIMERITASDMAVLTTSNDHAYASIDFERPSAHEPVTLIGYGMNGDDHDSAGVLRMGSNVIDSVFDQSIIVVGRSENTSKMIIFSKATGKSATANHGDSGGPLLKNGKIIGVASNGGDNYSGLFGALRSVIFADTSLFNRYVPVFTAQTKEFLESALTH